MPSPSRALLSVWGAACWWPELKAIPALSLGLSELLKRGASRLIPLYLPLYLVPCRPGPVLLPVASGPGDKRFGPNRTNFFLQATGCYMGLASSQPFSLNKSWCPSCNERKRAVLRG